MNHEVGKLVYVKTKYSLIACTVIKVTPKGLIDVRYNHVTTPYIKRFNRDGEMMPQDKWSPHYLLSDETTEKEQAYEAKKKALIEVANALRDAKPSDNVSFHYGSDGLARQIDAIQEKLDVARKLLAEIK